MDKMRNTAVNSAKVSHKFNVALMKAYRKSVDILNVLEMSPMIEKYQAQDREYEVGVMKKQLDKFDKWRRELWLPAWKASGLWPPDFKPDPRRLLENRNLPYLGGAPAKRTALDDIIGDLDK